MSEGHTITTEPAPGHLRIVIGGETFADSTRAVQLNETGLPARFYVPREDGYRVYTAPNGARAAS